MKKLLPISLLAALIHPLFGQVPHQDFLGGGHQVGVTVTSSSSATSTRPHATIDGFPISNEEQLKDASRFLAQATFGADWATIQMAAAMGYDAWLDEQFLIPYSSIMDEMTRHGWYDGSDGEQEPIYHTWFRTAWMSTNLTAPDLLRQRMAYNYSQILVVNDASDEFEDFGQMLAYYYDLLGTNAFHTYEDMLLDVTFSPMMGKFLTYYDNPKANPEENIHPDENYAREIMQLFTIGLWELNPNGIRRVDSTGAYIPTYDQTDIDEYAQVFTGLGSGGIEPDLDPEDEEEEEAYNRFLLQQFTQPMVMNPDLHDESEKVLLNGVVLPAGQDGLADIEQAVHHLVMHPNTAPFIVWRLIQFMTTSTPSPASVTDVVKVFDPTQENNLEEVTRAILLHPEARRCTPTEEYTFGKLREPQVRLMNYLRAFPIHPNEEGDYLEDLYDFRLHTGQAPLGAPSVFNFYLPEYRPQGPIGKLFMYAPEFQILTSTNAIGYINDLNYRLLEDGVLYGFDPEEEDEEDEDEENGEEDEEDYENLYRIDYGPQEELLASPEELVNHLDILLANGQLTATTKQIIVDAVAQVANEEDALRMAIYLILISPDYVILK